MRAVLHHRDMTEEVIHLPDEAMFGVALLKRGEDENCIIVYFVLYKIYFVDALAFLYGQHKIEVVFMKIMNKVFPFS